jgi:hypothetical protein
MAQHSIVKLATQGDPRAIAYLITRTLGKYGITARANRKGHCLKLLLEAERVPHQSTMVKLVTQGMQKLNVAGIQTVKLYGRKKGQTVLAWRQVIELTPHKVHKVEPTPEAKFDYDSLSDYDSAEMPIFRLDDLDPDTMILLPVEPTVQLDDLDPNAMILLPVEPEALEALEISSVPTSNPTPVIELGSEPVNLSAKLPKRLTLLLLGLLWIRLLIDTLRVVYSLLGAGSLSLYTGLDLGNTNQPFASLLSVIVGIADFVFTPLDRLGLWINLLVVVLSLVWLHRLHASLRDLFGSYPISPTGAVLRFGVPIYNFWGIGSTLFTLAKRLANEAHLNRSGQLIRRLTVWLYLFMVAAAGLQSSYFWLINFIPPAFTSLWFYVARDSVVWLLSLVWLRLVRVIWRAVRKVYQDRVVPFLPPRPDPRTRSSPVNLRAILLGAGASLLSLTLFNLLLGLLAAFVFVSNNLNPESILPTFYDSESLLTLVLLGSFFCIGLGGFVTAALARVARLIHALALGILLTLIGVLLQRSALVPAVEEMPFWFQTVSTVLIIPAALIGGGLRQWLKTL